MPAKIYGETPGDVTEISECILIEISGEVPGTTPTETPGIIIVDVF